MAGGYDIGASLSGSASSGASLSGATDQRGGGNYGGTGYGPGALVTFNQQGSLGAGTGGISVFWIMIAGAVLAVVWIFKN